MHSSDSDHLHADDVLVARFDLPHDILSRLSIEVDAGDRGMGAFEDDVPGNEKSSGFARRRWSLGVRKADVFDDAPTVTILRGRSDRRVRRHTKD